MKVEELINEELERAAEIHGDKFNSRHEGYAVLLEEVEELRQAVNGLEDDLRALWWLTKRDNTNVHSVINGLKSSAKNAIEEAIQVGAMVEKINVYYEENYPPILIKKG